MGNGQRKKKKKEKEIVEQICDNIVVLERIKMNEKVKLSSKIIIWCIILTFLVLCMSIILAPEHPKQLVKAEAKPTFNSYSPITDIQVWRSIGLMEVTAYCPCEKCCGNYADGITASGYKIQYGDRFVAAPKMIPFGTEIIISGYNNNKPVKILDRGGAIKVGRLDVYFDSHKEALKWGRQYHVEVWAKKKK